MKLLKEVHQLTLTEEKLNELRENDREGKPIIVTGVIQRADAKNQNNRKYPYNILKKECDRYQDEFVSKGLALGELDHTEEPIIQLKNVSHVIDEIFWDDKDVYGKVRLLNTPAGKIAKEIVLSGIPLGISSRAVGSVSKNEAMDEDVVGEDLNLICFDLVGTPSTHNAYLKLHESKEIINFDRDKVLPPELRIKQALSDILKK